MLTTIASEQMTVVCACTGGVGTHRGMQIDR
jgi:hypothetical protein